MNKFFKLSLLLTALSFLWACSSQQSLMLSDQKVRIAKINTELGMAYLSNNDVEKAKRKFLMALEQAPDLPEAWYSMGYYLEVTGDTDQAKTHYLKAIQLAPKNGEAHNNYGTFLCRIGDYKNGIEQFMLAIKDPQYVQTAAAYENSALCALKIPDLKMAMLYFDKALRHDPRLTISLFELAKLDYHFGYYQEAEMRLNQYLSYAPATPQSDQLKSQLKLKHER